MGYSTSGTCCTSKYATKSDCPGSFTTHSAWKGHVVCSGSSPTSGFNADLAASIHAGRGWREITNWRTSGNNEMYESLGEFNNGNGRFYPKETGYYLCNANAVLDGFTASGSSRLMLVINNHRDVNNGLMAIEANGGSTNWRGMSVGGTVMIKKGQYLSVQTYSSNDNSYYIRTETGFSCHAFSTKYGFHADKNGNQGFGRSWREVTNFRTSGTYGLHSLGTTPRSRPCTSAATSCVWTARREPVTSASTW